MGISTIAGFAGAQRRSHHIPDLVWMVHVVALGAEEPSVFVVARVADVTADVARVVEVLLVGLLRAPAVVVHDDRHRVDAVAHGGLEVLGVHQEPAVAVDGDDGRLGAAELGAECDGEGEAESAEIERGEKRAGPREVQAIVAVGRCRARVERDDRLRRERAPQLRIDALRLHRLGVEPALGVETSLAFLAQRLRFLPPGLRRRVGTGLGESVQQGYARFPRVGLDAHGDRIVAADVAALDVDLDDARPRLDVAVVEERREVPEPRADDQQHVGPPAGRARFGRARAPERTDVERMRVGHGVVPAVRGDHRDRVLLAQARDEIAGPRPGDAAADQQEGTLGLAQQARGLAHRVRMRRLRVGDAVGFGRADRSIRERSVQDVAGDLDEDRPAAAGHGRAQRRAQQLGDALGLGDLHGELGDRTEHRHQIELLERVLAVVLRRNPAHEDDHGRMRDIRRGDAGEQVRSARPARHQADAGQIRHSRQTVGHEGGGLLVAHVDVFHAVVVVERVEDVEKGRAYDPEDVPHLLRLEQFDHRVSTRQLGHTSTSRPRI
jgi:hypothetical protein